MFGLVGFSERSQRDDDRKLADNGVNGSTPEAVPFYARWIREDLVGIFYMLNLVVILLILIAIPLWKLAFW